MTKVITKKNAIEILEAYASEYHDYIAGVQETEEDWDRTLNDYIRMINQDGISTKEVCECGARDFPFVEHNINCPRYTKSTKGEKK